MILVDLKDVLKILDNEAEFYSREIARRRGRIEDMPDGPARDRALEFLRYAIVSRNTYQNAASKLDLELGYGLGRLDDQ